MKVFTSYFYQIRFFKPFQIPISTAKWDPKWFHDGKSQSHLFIDRRGVLNGCRAEALAPGTGCDGLCHGKPCAQSPTSCEFLAEYAKQLQKVSQAELIGKLTLIWNRWATARSISEEPEFIFIVHEAPTNECSERKVLQNWLKCEEWHQ